MSESEKKLIIVHIYPHCFRHTFATRLFEAGLPGPYVQRILEHSSYDTTLALSQTEFGGTT